jgi:hypothetical protein
VKLPEGASMVTQGGVVVVQIAKPHAVADEAAAAAEPELIRKAKEDAAAKDK